MFHGQNPYTLWQTNVALDWKITQVNGTIVSRNGPISRAMLTLPEGTLLQLNIAIENCIFCVFPVMVMFRGYVRLPEGISHSHPIESL